MTLVQLDRTLGISLRQQIRAALVHRISTGTLAVGAPLPSVRDLADEIGTAPMTVSKVYADLKAAGLVEARIGAGTFVADSDLARRGAGAEIEAIKSGLDALVDRAAAAGLSSADIVAMLNARAIHRVAAAPKPDFVMAGLFPDATRSYAERISGQLGEGASVTPLVVPADVDGDDAIALRLREADLIVTFASLHDRVAALAPGRPVVSVRFIPAETTRLALASLDPMARVAVVSRFADFLPVLELGVRRFAPHVASVVATEMETPGLARRIEGSDVVVMSTGAEAAGDMAGPEAVRIEYRHIPDPGDVARLILPHLATSEARADPAPTTPPQPRTGDRKEAS